MVLAMYATAIFMGTLYWTILSMATGFTMFTEIMAINRSVAKDRLNILSGPLLEYATYLAVIFQLAPRTFL